MRADQIFQKALMQLDRGQVLPGEESLRTAIQTASDEGDVVTRIGALCCLGELLLGQGRDSEARGPLEEVVAYQSNDDRLAYEQQRARELLDTIE